jgi:hypothetical protein
LANSATAGRAGDDDAAACGRNAAALERQHRQHRGVTRGADGHRLARAHARGQPHQPVALNARLFRIGAEMGFAETPAVEDHLVAGLPQRMRGALHRAGEIDAGDHGETPHHRRFAGERKPVLIIECRVFDCDGNVAVHQILFVEIG